jgi:hypothetical protein
LSDFLDKAGPSFSRVARSTGRPTSFARLT